MFDYWINSSLRYAQAANLLEHLDLRVVLNGLQSEAVSLHGGPRAALSIILEVENVLVLSIRSIRCWQIQECDSIRSHPATGLLKRQWRRNPRICGADNDGDSRSRLGRRTQFSSRVGFPHSFGGKLPVAECKRFGWCMFRILYARSMQRRSTACG